MGMPSMHKETVDKEMIAVKPSNHPKSKLTTSEKEKRVAVVAANVSCHLKTSKKL